VAPEVNRYVRASKDALDILAQYEAIKFGDAGSCAGGLEPALGYSLRITDKGAPLGAPAKRIRYSSRRGKSIPPASPTS
jgi:hypothetical protein